MTDKTKYLVALSTALIDVITDADGDFDIHATINSVTLTPTGPGAFELTIDCKGDDDPVVSQAVKEQIDDERPDRTRPGNTCGPTGQTT